MILRNNINLYSSKKYMNNESNESNESNEKDKIHLNIDSLDNNSLSSSLSDNSSVFGTFSLTGSIIEPREQNIIDINNLAAEEVKKEIERLNKKIIYDDWRRNKEEKKNEIYIKQLLEESIDRMGLKRLSTIKRVVHHIGNSLEADEWFNELGVKNKIDKVKTVRYSKRSHTKKRFKTLLRRIVRKILFYLYSLISRKFS